MYVVTTSEICGALSIFCWILVFTPQMYKNYKQKSGKSLSLTFLWIWLVADVFNIVGAALENLLPTVIILAVYYTVADLILICQVYYYGDGNMDEDEEREHDPLLAIVQAEESSRTGWIIFSTTFFLAWTLVALVYMGVPQYLGWSSAILYIGSRVPQIYKNYRGTDTTGLSMYMFVLGILGNYFFYCSIIYESAEWEFLKKNMPWLIGAVGTVFLDVIITWQILWARKRASYQLILRDGPE
jgi:solute carrier family 66 (lysosomal lysine-arginine transporter), member 1